MTRKSIYKINKVITFLLISNSVFRNVFLDGNGPQFEGLSGLSEVADLIFYVLCD